MTQLIGFKICKGECKLPKSDSEFYRNGKGKRCTKCIDCMKTYRKKYTKPRKIRANSRFIFDDNKLCSICDDIKNRKLFMQHSSKCKECSGVAINAPRVRRTKEDYIIDKKKVCTICDRTKDVDLFYPNKNHISGYSSSCKACAVLTRFERKAFYVKPTKQDAKDEFLDRWRQIEWR